MVEYVQVNITYHTNPEIKWYSQMRLLTDFLPLAHALSMSMLFVSFRFVSFSFKYNLFFNFVGFDFFNNG